MPRVILPHMNLDKSSIERLKKRLYARGGAAAEVKRSFLRKTPAAEVSDTWQPDAPPKPSPSYSGQAILKYVLIGAIIFFVGSLLVSAFLITQNAPISPEKVHIEVQGPAAVGGGEELTLQILVRNENAAAIQNADLVIEFPEGTRSPEDLEVDLPRIRESLGTIKAGGEVQKTARAVLFGEENSEQVVTFYVEYRVAGSSATFSSQEQTYPVVLTSAPLSVLVESVKEITSGQPLEFEVTVASNADTELKDVLLSAEYPFGFSYEHANPRPAFRNSVWELGDLKPEERKTVSLRGTLIGENEQERVFRFAAGNRSARNETEMGTAFMTALETVTIQRPFIGAQLAINGSGEAEPTVERGDRVRADITWFNNLPARVYDAEITVELSGAAIDRRTINASGGFYRSANDTITWTRETDPDLAELDEGDRGSVTFSFETLGLDAGELREPEIELVVHVQGTRLSENDVPETIESSVSRTIKIPSDLLLTSRAVYVAGPFENEGPLPPEVGEQTSYTILWTVTNSSNAVSDVSVSGTLPSYVRFGGAVEPESADVSYSQVGGEVTWEVGSLEPGARKDVAFQIEFEPSLGQVGSAPVLVGDQSVRGVDTFTGVSVSDTWPALTTRITTDQGYTPDQDQVVE